MAALGIVGVEIVNARACVETTQKRSRQSLGRTSGRGPRRHPACLAWRSLDAICVWPGRI
eukprot:5695048-Lingulodinium_polyedra.AAC.1